MYIHAYIEISSEPAPNLPQIFNPKLLTGECEDNSLGSNLLEVLNPKLPTG
jgi:hypothetical protein